MAEGAVMEMIVVGQVSVIVTVKVTEAAATPV
jgi:hypothetical protein